MKLLKLFSILLFIAFSMSNATYAQDLNADLEKMMKEVQKAHGDIFKNLEKSMKEIDLNKVKKNLESFGQNFEAGFNSEGINIQKKRFSKNGKDYLEIHITPENKSSDIHVELKDTFYSIKGNIKEESSRHGHYHKKSRSYSSSRSLPEGIVGKATLRKEGNSSIIKMQIDPKKVAIGPDHFGDLFNQMKKQMDELLDEDHGVREERPKSSPQEENNRTFKLKKLKERRI